MASWIVQGNPKKYDLDGYLSRHPDFIYWTFPQHAKEASVGDAVYLWRAGQVAGVVASGRIAEGPVESRLVSRPEVLGDDLWSDAAPTSERLVIGIRLESVRLDREAGMIPKSLLMNHPQFLDNGIVRAPRQTVYRMSSGETSLIASLWGHAAALSGTVEYLEGGWREGHMRRDRNPHLRRARLEQMHRQEGALHCQACGLREGDSYPARLGDRVFEVHHKVPISTYDKERPTSLDDLLVVCANCHRAIHANDDIEGNLRCLLDHFGSTTD